MTILLDLLQGRMTFWAFLVLLLQELLKVQ
jgi:hypothetical protein